jgi:hypothetical protein
MKYSLLSQTDSSLTGIASGSLSIGHDPIAASRNYVTPVTGIKFLISGVLVAPISAGVLSFGGYPADLESNTLTIRRASPSAKSASTHYDFRWEDQSNKESSAVAQVFMDPTYELLGPHGVSRLNEFRCYLQGWDNGNGTPLSPASEKQFTTFLQKFAGELGKLRPSVFLTREGNLQLGWEDKSGKAVEVEFFPSHLEFFVESSNEEGTLRIEDAKKLFQDT